MITKVRLINLLFLLALSTSLSCAGMYLRDKANDIQPGQHRDYVISILGPPDDRQFRAKNEALQWCAKGTFGNDNLIVWFKDSKVTGLNSYSTHAVSGSCTNQLKEVRWENAPDAVVEVRKR